MNLMRRLILCIVAAVLVTEAPSHAQTRAGEARLPDPLYPDIVAIGRSGRPSEALAELAQRVGGTDGDAPVEAQILRARLLFEAGQFRQSAAAWQAIALRAPELASVAVREAANGFLEDGDRERTEAVLRGHPPDEVGDILTRLATAYREAGQADRAADLYRRVIAAPPSNAVAEEAVLGLAGALELLGDRAAALSQLVTLQRRFRESDSFAVARSEGARLARDLGRRQALFTDAQYRALVDRLLNRSLFSDAMSVLEEWKAAFPGSARRVDALVVDALYRARLNAEARSRAAAFLAQYPDDGLAADVRVLVFRLDVREGRTQDVRTRGDALWTGRVPGIPQSDRLELGRLLAAYLVSIGEVDEGLSVYRRVYRAATSPDFQADIMWRVSVAAIRAGQLDRAETNLRALQRRDLDREVSLLVEYWTAVLAERRLQPREAVRGYTALAAREPYHYYGIRARERLVALQAGVPEPDARLTFPSTALQVSSRTTPAFRGATLLARAGLMAEAARVARDLADARRADRALALLAARASADAGEYRLAVGLIETRFLSFVERPAHDVPSDFFELAYPQAYWEEVRQAGAATGVDPRLLLSLARQESRYDPSVRSVVGAVGLFQIMPYTADALAPRVGIDATNRALLLMPEVSARFAARLVADLMRLFDGADTAVVAAYNAGDERGATWWRASRGVADDLFVDTIPYSETRIYVRRVYANYVTYRKLYRLD